MSRYHSSGDADCLTDAARALSKFPPNDPERDQRGHNQTFTLDRPLVEQDERWLSVVDYPAYKVSSKGRVFSALSGKFLKPITKPDGYLAVSLYHNRRPRQFRLSRLICEIFHGPAPTGKHHAAHLDGNALNNCADNLCWATPIENESHKRAHGTKVFGEAAFHSVLSAQKVEAIWLGPTPTTLAASKFGVSTTSIKSIRSGRTWRHVTKDLPPQPKRIRARPGVSA